jgi:putative inorganic carbon (hco3(-)) transporter
VPAGLVAQERLALLAASFLFPLAGATLTLPWLLGLRIAQFVKARTVRWVRSPIDVPIVGFLTLALVAGLRSPQPYVALGSWVLAILAFIVVLQAVLEMLRNRPEFRLSLHKAFCLGTLCAAIYGLIVLYQQHLERVPLSTSPPGYGFTGRAQLLTLGPNALGFGLAAGILLSLPLLGEVFPWPMIATATVMVATIGTIATWSRGAFFELVVGGGVYLWLARRALPWRAMLVAFSAVTFGLLVVLNTPLIAHSLAVQLKYKGLLHGPVEGMAMAGTALRYLASSGTYRDRLPIWAAALRIIGAHPWFGIGLGVFPLIVHRVATEIIAGTPAHNLFLNVAAEVGIPGAVAFAAMPVTAIIWALKRRDPCGYGEVAAMTGMLIAELRDNILIGYHMFLGFVVMLAMLLVSSVQTPSPLHGTEHDGGV